MSTRDRLLAERERIERLLRENEEKWIKFGPEPDKGNVIMFDVGHSGRTYTYVALRVESGWYVTGKAAGSEVSWEKLLDLMGGSDGYWIATMWSRCSATAAAKRSDDESPRFRILPSPEVKTETVEEEEVTDVPEWPEWTI